MQLHPYFLSALTLFLVTYVSVTSFHVQRAEAEEMISPSPINTKHASPPQPKKVSKKYPIFVESNLPAGIYTKAITVKLTASDPNAQIWYTCKLNSTPGDLIKYEKPIVLEKSCALVFFAFIDYQNESKIERNNYTIIYSNDVKLETNNGVLSLKNSGTGTVDIGSWNIIAGTGGTTIPPGTTLTPNSIYSLGKVDPKSYELKSPEGFLKDSIQITPRVVKKLREKSLQGMHIIQSSLLPKNPTPPLSLQIVEGKPQEIPEKNHSIPSPQVPSVPDISPLPPASTLPTPLTPQLKANSQESNQNIPITGGIVLLVGCILIAGYLTRNNLLKP
jgi:hypothetical protein